MVGRNMFRLRGGRIDGTLQGISIPGPSSPESEGVSFQVL